ncbi:MAG: LLM class flavin-dependent oxidoreductase [Opitutaceae bacterium]|jgi:luciferase family oxidoreductase group 1
MALKDIPRSVLDLSPVLAGGTPGGALRDSLALARHAEKLGYHRYWVAEHHNITGIASAATSVVIGHLAAGTERIRVGAGGIMLANHAPLVIAEQFGTLESLFPGRIDLGLGRAPGGDQAAARALRRTLGTSGEDFPQLLEELRGYFKVSRPGQAVRAVPGEGLNVPIWLLSSSGFSAELAGLLGLPFAFAGQFAPQSMVASCELYRRVFRPSGSLLEPYVMVGVNVVAADNDEAARRLATSHQQAFLNLIRGQPGRLPPPVDEMAGHWSPAEEAAVAGNLSASIIGGPETVRRGLDDLLARTQANEIIMNAMIFDQSARLKSYEIIAGVWAK